VRALCPTCPHVGLPVGQHKVQQGQGTQTLPAVVSCQKRLKSCPTEQTHGSTGQSLSWQAPAAVPARLHPGSWRFLCPPFDSLPPLSRHICLSSRPWSFYRVGYSCNAACCTYCILGHRMVPFSLPNWAPGARHSRAAASSTSSMRPFQWVSGVEGRALMSRTWHGRSAQSLRVKCTLLVCGRKKHAILAERLQNDNLVQCPRPLSYGRHTLSFSSGTPRTRGRLRVPVANGRH
jgi:hypothetical protein